MSSTGNLITSIQGLSASSGDLSALHRILKGAEETLLADSDLELSTLEQLEPSKHSLGYLYHLPSPFCWPREGGEWTAPILDEVEIANTRRLMMNECMVPVMKLYFWDKTATDFCKKFISYENTPTMLYRLLTQNVLEFACLGCSINHFLSVIVHCLNTFKHMLKEVAIYVLSRFDGNFC
ncbi:hypothetical protein YC2023_066524 [Brassica napus]